jgi:hypothetical protein
VHFPNTVSRYAVQIGLCRVPLCQITELQQQLFSRGSELSLHVTLAPWYRIVAQQPETDSFASYSRIGLEKLMVARLLRTSSHFMEPERLLLLCSEAAVVGPGFNQLNKSRAFRSCLTQCKIFLTFCSWCRQSSPFRLHFLRYF